MLIVWHKTSAATCAATGMPLFDGPGPKQIIKDKQAGLASVVENNKSFLPRGWRRRQFLCKNNSLRAWNRIAPLNLIRPDLQTLPTGSWWHFELVWPQARLPTLFQIPQTPALVLRPLWNKLTSIVSAAQQQAVVHRSRGRCSNKIG